MNAVDRDLWDNAIRDHDRKVVLSLLALGLPPDQAREVAQTAWTHLMEKHAAQELPDLRLPGLVMKQARFLALTGLRRGAAEGTLLRAVPEPAPDADVEHVIIGREQLGRVRTALSACPPVARRVFRLVYGEPNLSHAEVAQRVGLSLQRVRQILCETRKELRRAIDGGSK